LAKQRRNDALDLALAARHGLKLAVERGGGKIPCKVFNRTSE
jgi:hypothetical protein